jgi:hypothetical protein
MAHKKASFGNFDIYFTPVNYGRSFDKINLKHTSRLKGGKI